MSYSNKLYIILFVKALAFIAFIFYGSIGLGPDEAQYWTWSQVLDWGYYSKPPAIAWQIAAGTSIFSNTELGVRFFSVILSFFQAILIYRLAKVSGLSERTAFWCGLMMAFSPLGILGSLFAVTDGGFLLFWTLACFFLFESLNKSKEPSPLLVGSCILAGALFKWPIYAFWLVYFISRKFYFPKQKLSQVILGVLVSLLGLFPSLWWNMHHDWPTFRHVFATVKGGSGEVTAGGNPLEFLGSQVALLSPVLFGLFIYGIYKYFKNFCTLSPALQVAGMISISYFVLFLTFSMFQKIQGNWSLAIYPTAFIMIGWAAPEKVNWMRVGIIFSIALAGLLIVHPWLPYRMNPLKHNLGWRALGAELTEKGFNPHTDFLFSDKYQTTSILSFYGPGQERAYFLNLNGARKNQFSYWPSFQQERKGLVGYFVWVENAPRWERDFEIQKSNYQKQLTDYFGEVEFLGDVALLEDQSRVLKGALIFKCSDYNGKNEPEEGRY